VSFAKRVCNACSRPAPSIAAGTAAHDGVKAAERAYDEARAVANAADQRVSGWLQALHTRIERMDSAIQIQHKQFEQQITIYWDRIIKIRASTTTEHAAVVTGAIRSNTR